MQFEKSRIQERESYWILDNTVVITSSEKEIFLCRTSMHYIKGFLNL